MDYTANLNRFIEAQNSPGFAGYNNAVEEIRQGKKLSHWIWYVFPQLKSLSQNSPYDKKFGLENLEEAKAYLNNPTLRKRLDDVCEILLKHEDKTASGIFGVTDSSRVRSSMTIFYLASNNDLYKQVLDKYYNGRPCQNTLYALNMRMPESSIFSNSENSHKPQKSQNKKHQTVTRPQQFAGVSRQRSLKKRKMKKVAILVVGFVSVIALFGGMGYGVYSLFLDNKDTPVIAEANPEVPDSPNIALRLNVSVMTSDQEAITFDDKDKYAMSLMASMGNNPIPLDSSTSKFKFLYNNENSSEEIKIDARVESCQIGGQTYSMSNYDVREGSFDETFNLDVSKEDLRIYEELAWYLSANKKVSSEKYPKYVDRIKKVQNQEFAALLTQKLSSVGKSQEVHTKDDVKKDDAKKKELGELPEEIRSKVNHGLRISDIHLKELSSSERHIVIEYNRWTRDVFRMMDKEQRLEVLERLSGCKTFRALESTIRSFKVRLHSTDI